MKRLVLIFMLITIVPEFSPAHSTKGKTKVPLTKETLNIDDVAYYTESFVTRKKYKEKFEKSGNRFYVYEFKELKQDHDRAEVFFRVMDMKEKDRIFDDSMVFSQNRDGVWRNIEAPEDKVYTYVTDKGVMRKYIVPVSLACLVLYGLGSSLYRYVRDRKESLA